MVGGDAAIAGDGASLPFTGRENTKCLVAYFYEPPIDDYHYGRGHPMKPHRIQMAHSLIVHYSLHRLLQISRPFPASAADIRRFNSDDYADFLSSVSPSSLPSDASSAYANSDNHDSKMLKRFNVGADPLPVVG